jgi:SAM-dependent methyltransferase
MKHRFAGEYCTLEEWHWWFRGRRRILEAVLRREVSDRRVLRIASLGCGPARGVEWLAEIPIARSRVVGIDLDPGHGRARGRDVDFVAARLEALPLAGGAFEMVVALDVLEHLVDDAAGLEEAGRLVAPGGLLVVTVPALPSLWGRQDEVSEHYRRYTRRSLLDLFARAGLHRPRITHFNTLLFAPVAAVRWTRRALGTSSAGGSDFAKNRPGLLNDLLAHLFAAERHLVGRVPLPAGVSLLAMLRA